MDSWMHYSLGKSAISVDLKKKRRRAGYDLFMQWLKSHTKYKIDQDGTLGLYMAVGEEDPKHRLEFVEEKFGKAKRSDGSRLSDGTVTSYKYEWKIAHEDAETVLDILEHADKTHNAKHNFIYYQVIECVLLDDEGEELPGQSLDEDAVYSQFSLCLDRNATVIPDINFPFPEANAEFKVYYKWFKRNAPFVMKDENLKECHVSEHGAVLAG